MGVVGKRRNRDGENGRKDKQLQEIKGLPECDGSRDENIRVDQGVSTGGEVLNG